MIRRGLLEANNMRRFAISMAASAAVLAAGAAHAAPATMYSTNFDISSLYAGVGVVQAGPGAIGNFGANNYGGATGNFLYNDTIAPQMTTWTLSNLPGHTSVTVDLTPMFIDSWDSTNGSPAPDYYDIYFDGNLVLRMTSANASGNVTDLGPGGVSTYFGNVFYGGYNERIADITALTIGHTGSSFVLGIQASGSGWQGGGDESWGVDNINISADLRSVGGIPEPATWAMMIVGFAGVGSALRSRRKALVAA